MFVVLCSTHFDLDNASSKNQILDFKTRDQTFCVFRREGHDETLHVLIEMSLFARQI